MLKRALKNFLVSKITDLPTFAVPILRNERWILSSILSPPRFPGWTECTFQPDLNPYGSKGPDHSMGVSLIPSSPSSNIYSFTFVAASYGLSFRKLAEIRYNIKVIIDGDYFRVYLDSENQVKYYFASYIFPASTPIQIDSGSFNYITDTETKYTQLYIPPHMINTCFENYKDYQFFTYLGCFDAGYDGTDYYYRNGNYKEGYIHRRGNNLIVKLPFVDIYEYNQGILTLSQFIPFEQSFYVPEWDY